MPGNIYLSFHHIGFPETQALTAAVIRKRALDRLIRLEDHRRGDGS